MITFKRMCIEDWSVSDGTDTCELKRGTEYTTSAEKNGTVTVFTRYWVEAPASLFAGEKQAHRSA